MNMLTGGLSGRKARNSHADVVEQLGRDIVQGRMPVGHILPGDADLSARFQVSRTVLREAMKTLSAKGLVTARTRVGTSVRERSHWNLFDADVLAWHLEAELDSDFFHDISEVRLAIEPFVAAIASERASEADIAQLRRMALEMGRPDHTPETLAVADLNFHLALAETTKNPFLSSVGALIETAMLAALRLSSSDKVADRVETISADHLKIVEAVSGRDPKAAHAAMERVIRIGMERVSRAQAISATPGIVRV
jgi:DNA-binding FadR family transcriptional regulator